MTLGQEFGGYAACVAARRRRRRARRREQLHELNLGATAVGTGLNAGDDYRAAVDRQPRALHRPAAAAGREPVPRHAEHGRRARLLRRDAAARRRARQDRERSAAAEHGAARRALRDRAAGRAAGLVDHAGQGESVGARDGQPGLLPGDRLRHDGRAGVRGRTARAERDDAGHRVERAARVDDSARGDEGAARRAASTASSADAARARELLDRSTAVATALSPYIGYAATAEIAKESVADRPVRSASSCSSAGCWTPTQLDAILSVEAMTRGGDRRATERQDRPDGAGRRVTARALARALPDRRICARCARACAAPARRRSRAARPAVPAAGSRPARGPGSRRSGRSPIRSWTRSGSPTARSSPTSAPAAAGSRSGSRGASGPNGLVYAEDIQPQMIEAISRRVQRENLHERHAPCSARPNDPRLPHGHRRRADRRRVSRDGESAGRSVTLLQERRARRSSPQGRIGIVDFIAGRRRTRARARRARRSRRRSIAAAAAAGLQLHRARGRARRFSSCSSSARRTPRVAVRHDGHAHRADDRRQRLERRRRHSGRSQDVRRLRRVRHERDHGDHRAEHGRASTTTAPLPADLVTAQIEAVAGDIDDPRDQDRHARDRGDRRSRRGGDRGARAAAGRRRSGDAVEERRPPARRRRRPGAAPRAAAARAAS